MNGCQKGWELPRKRYKQAHVRTAEMMLKGRKGIVKTEAVAQAVFILFGTTRKSEKYHPGNLARWL